MASRRERASAPLATPQRVVALRERRIAGAGLDVTAEHHLQGDLVQLQNVVLTPHIGFKTTEALATLAEIAIENVGRFLRGEGTHRLWPD